MLRGVLLSLLIQDSWSVFAHDAPYAQGLPSSPEPFWVHDGEFEAMSLPFSFAGLNTFAKVPYANCFGNDSSSGSEFDIAILGAPHDTVSI